MSLTLFETFRQIDPYVWFTDGASLATAGAILESLDRSDPTEYVMMADGVGRLLIYRLDVRGRVIVPPVYVEEKIAAPRGTLAAIRPQRRDFGPGMHGCV
jgi:hypothetical protein